MVEGSGFEKGCASTPDDETAEKRPNRDTAPAVDSQVGPGPRPTPEATSDDDLKAIVTQAAADRQWDIVRQYGRILEARAMAAAGNVVAIDSKRRDSR